MACGRPVVASREAAMGVAEESLPGLTVVDTRQEWISALEQLLVVDCYAEQEGLAARAWVRENFSWPERLEQMERVLLGPCVLETRSAAAGDVLAGRRMTAEAAV
jgi:glycosyltransferase involved in cell wall biosynthesis